MGFCGERYHAAAFFGQQTAEKALYIERLLKLPRTHDLIELAEALGVGTGLLEMGRVTDPAALAAVLAGSALPIERAWLFGSRARGDALEELEARKGEVGIVGEALREGLRLL